MPFLQSNVLAALITVVLGTFGGTIIATKIQSDARETADLQAERLANLDQERKAFNNAWATINQTLVASEYLMMLAGKIHDPSRKDLSATDRTKISKENDTVEAAYSEALGKWDTEKSRLGMNLMMFNENPSSISGVWIGLSNSVDDFASCANNYWKETIRSHIEDPDAKTKCEQKLATANQNLLKLSPLIVNATAGKHKKTSFWSRLFCHSE